MQKPIKDFLTELLFPSFCLGCHREGTLLCQDCRETLDISQYHYCLCNQNPIRLAPEATVKNTCNRCHNRHLSGLYFALPYKEKWLTRKLIFQFKYEPNIKSLAKPLAQIIASHLLITNKNTEDIWENSVLVPVPMDRKKEKRRGYNQTVELAKEIGQIINVLPLANVLAKVKPTPPQMTLKKEEREKNLIGAFQVINPEGVNGKKIFLVDDVYTTGSTMEECAKTLKAAGAKSVWGITIAREG